MTTQRAVLADRLGGPEVLEVADVPVPAPGEGRVLLDVRSVGLNPYDSKVREGIAPREAPFPRGVGSDVAGIVLALGEGAAFADGTPIAVGQAVFGWGLNTLRERLVVRGASVTPVPDGLSLATAGALTTPALAGRSLFDAVPVGPDDVVLVSGASGAVGFLVAQWARMAGARVIGTAGAANADRLRAAGIEPVEYGAGLQERLRGLLGARPLTAAFDTSGADSVRTAVALGAPAARVATIAGDDDTGALGAVDVDTSKRSTATLTEVAAQVAAGEVQFPVQAAFPLDHAADAYRLLDSRHLTGKVVVTPNA